MARAGRVLILADDLIWSTRLAALVRAAGWEAATVASVPAFEAALPLAERVIVDTTARRYDPLAAVTRAAAVGAPVICVGQHDDHAARRAALAAGARRVYAYRKLAEDGPATIGAWLGGEPADRGPTEEQAGTSERTSPR